LLVVVEESRRRYSIIDLKMQSDLLSRGSSGAALGMSAEG